MSRVRVPVAELPPRTQWILAAFILAMALAAAVLVLSVPPLFDAPEPHDLGVTAASGIVAALCAGVVNRLRPTVPDRAE
jgi:hypothetical protein